MVSHPVVVSFFIFSAVFTIRFNPLYWHIYLDTDIVIFLIGASNVVSRSFKTISDITTSSSDALSLPESLVGSLICCVSSASFTASIKVNSVLFLSFNVLMASKLPVVDLCLPLLVLSHLTVFRSNWRSIFLVSGCFF